MTGRVLSGVLVASFLAVPLSMGVAGQARAAQANPSTQRVNERIRSLQREADRLAGEAKTLVGELRKLEIERDLRIEEARTAEAAAAASQQTLTKTTARLTALEAQQVAQLPDLKAQLVDVYKRGAAGYARVLLSTTGVRDFARAARAVSALAALEQRRIEEHRRTVEAVRRERADIERQTKELQAQQAQARRARGAAERAVNARSALIAEIDARRDLTAQYVGELQQSSQALQQRLTDLAAGRPASAVALPLVPFRGALEWPVAGRVTGAFGQTNRSATTTVRNGVEIAAAEGTAVHAVHGGVVGYSDTFTGLGTLVIVDHGANNYSLYGYLGATAVMRGDMVEEGAELGRVGTSPGGQPALYFEMRIDGKSVDPVQWLKPR